MILLNYFGEAAQPCGNCDVCLDPPQTWDGTVAAQKLISAVLRTGSRFGAGHLIDILRGKATDRVKQWATTGCRRSVWARTWTRSRGAAWRASSWRSGCCTPTPSATARWRVTAEARPVLRGETRLQLRRARPKRARGVRRADERAAVVAAQELDPALLDALRACAASSPARRTSRPTSSSTTPRCASWRGCARATSASCGWSRASASTRRSAMERSCSRCCGNFPL